MKGSVKGSLWAVALAGSGLSIASLAAPPVMRSDGPAEPQLQMPQPIIAAPADEALALNSATDTTPALTAPQQVSPVAEAETEVAVDTTPATPPPAAETADDMTAPETDTTTEVASGEDSAVATEEAAAMPAPEVDADVTVEADDVAAVETAPSEEPVSEVVVESPADETADAPVSDDMAATSEEAESTAETDTAATTQDAASQDVVEVQPEAPAEEAETALVTTSDPENAAAPLVVQTPMTEVDTSAEAVTEDAEVTEDPATEEVAAPASDADAEATQDVAAAAPEPAAEPEVIAPSTPASEIRINRPGAEESDPAGEGAVVISPDGEAEELPALEAFAATLDNPENLPLLAVILVDDGSNADAVADASALGFLPTVALNVLSADAATRMAAYRDAGVEIALQTGLPAGAQPADVEVAFEAAFDILPEAAMLFSDGSGLLQSDRAVTAQAMQVLASQGRGFVALRRGLGNATRAAQAIGVPAATIDREVETDGKDQRAIIRDLDQAAFRARQSGGGVLLGQASPEMLAALREWAATVDQGQLLIAPVSAVLLAQQD